MDFGSGECPSDAVAGVNPKFIGEKGQRLLSHVSALSANSRLPCCGLNFLWRDENR
jgi:hypothetical protein